MFDANLLGATASVSNYNNCKKKPEKQGEEERAMAVVSQCVANYGIAKLCDTSISCAAVSKIKSVFEVLDLLKRAKRNAEDYQKDIDASYNIVYGYGTTRK